jgi:hypothetical protein
MKKLFVILAALALVWAFAVPASAVDWNFYGSARMATFYTSQDFGDQTTGPPPGGQDDDDGTQWDLQGNSRIGARVKGETVNGRIELGINDAVPGGGTVTSRLVYGTWNFGAGTLKVGKDYTPVSQFISTQTFAADLGLLGIGTYYGLRQGQIALSFNRLNIALVTNTEGDVSTAPSGVGNVNYDGPGTAIPGVASGGDPDAYIPKIEASWGMSFDAFSFNLMGGFQYYTIEDVVQPNGSTDDVDVTSWVVGGDAAFTFGPAYIRGAISYDQNGGNAGWYSLPGAWDGTDDMDDVNVLQAALVAGWKMSDTVSFEVGGGMANQDLDVAGFDDTTPWSVYGNATIQLAPGVFIIPEVGYFDWDESGAAGGGNDLGETLYIGAKWQIDF